MVAANVNNFAQWFCTQRYLPYRLRKSFAKRICPKILSDHPFEIDFFGMKYTGNARDCIDRMVFFCGAYKKYTLFFLRDIVKSMRLKDLVFIDIGANVGNHSLYMSQYVEQVHAFEPYDKVRKQLETKITDNNITNISVHPVGLSNSKGSQSFYAPKDGHQGVGSFANDHYEQKQHVADLPVTVGDEEVKRLKLTHADVIKIDVEGVERLVLEGLHNTLKTFRPVIVLELSGTTRKTFNDFDDFRSVFPAEYDLLRFSKASREFGHYRVSHLDYESDYTSKDVIACPHEKLKYIAHLEVR